jgi:hypothetical protein
VLRHTADGLLAQRGVPGSAAAASLGDDPAVFLRTYAHVFPGDLRSVADAVDLARSDAVEARLVSVGDPETDLARVDFAGTNRMADQRVELRLL